MGLNCKNKNKKRDWTKLQFHKGFGLKCKIMKLVKKCKFEKQRKVKPLKMTKRTKTNKLPKMRYFKIPLCPKFK